MTSREAINPRAPIAHVLTSLALGGAESVALALARGQRARGHAVTVVSLGSPAEDALSAEFNRAGVQVMRVTKRSGLDATLPLRLSRAIERIAPRVVHTHNPLPLVYAAPVAARLGCRTVHTKHGPHPEAPHRLWLRRLAARSVDAFVAVSADAGAAAVRYGEATVGSLTLVPNGIDLVRYARSLAARDAVRAEWGISAVQKVIGTVGRIEPVKNTLGMLRAVLPCLGPECSLVFVGDGTDRLALTREAARLGVTRWVRVLGARRDVQRLLQGFDVFVLASHVEGLPLAVLEAMAASVPVVATRVGGIPDAFDGVATLVAPDAPIALGNAVGEILADPSFAAARATLALRRIEERYSEAAMLDRYEALYAAGRGSPSFG